MHEPHASPCDDAPSWQRTLASRLRAQRIARGLSVKQLASQARMYWVELDRYERAQQLPDLPRLYTLAHLLDTDLHALLPPSSRHPEESCPPLPLSATPGAEP